MSFTDKYNSAKQKLLSVRSKLLGKVLEAPVRDADAMKSYYERYKAFQETISLSPQVSLTGEERIAYLGGPLTNREVRFKVSYDGPTKGYVDYGDPAEPTYYLPSVPVIVWEKKPPDAMAVDVTVDQLRSSLMVFSEDLIEGVAPDFENAIFKYYYPTKVEAVTGKAYYDLYFFSGEVPDLAEPNALVVPYGLEGERFWAVWGQFSTLLYVYVYPNPIFHARVYPLPAYYASTWTRDERTVRLRGFVVIQTFTGGEEWNFLFYHHRFHAKPEYETVDTTEYRLDPVFAFGTRGGKLDPPVYAGRHRVAV